MENNKCSEEVVMQPHSVRVRVIAHKLEISHRPLCGHFNGHSSYKLPFNLYAYLEKHIVYGMKTNI